MADWPTHRRRATARKRYAPRRRRRATKQQ